MSGRKRALVTLAGGIAAVAVLWSLSGSAWGRSGSHPVSRKALQTAGIPGAEEGTYRLFLSVPFGEKGLDEIVVPQEVFHAVQEGDAVDYRARALPLAGIEAIDFEARHSGGSPVRWSEGYPFLFAGIGVGGLVAGLVVMGIVSLAANLLKLSGPPDV